MLAPLSEFLKAGGAAKCLTLISSRGRFLRNRPYVAAHRSIPASEIPTVVKYNL